MLKKNVGMMLAVILAAGVLAADETIVRPTREEVRSQLRRAPRFAGPSAAAPDAFQVKYSLAEAAPLSVTLLDLSRIPLRTFHVAAGEKGARAGENVLTVWDGRDSAGRDAPSGEYWVCLSFRHADGRVENKRFRINKP
ncbi:MAG TPA: hypothetical protein P5079_11700 [Elusimicrobiota bacterium]|nr:hypothetical protein [Elusimicrobiota bacterium]